MCGRPICCREAGIRAIYSGHDHDNDYVVELDGVRLAQGRKTGCAGCIDWQAVARLLAALNLRVGAAVEPSIVL